MENRKGEEEKRKKRLDRCICIGGVRLETSIRLDSISRPARPQSPSPFLDEWQSNRGFEICVAVLHDSGPGLV